MFINITGLIFMSSKNTSINPFPSVSHTNIPKPRSNQATDYFLSLKVFYSDKDMKLLIFMYQ